MKKRYNSKRRIFFILLYVIIGVIIINGINSDYNKENTTNINIVESNQYTDIILENIIIENDNSQKEEAQEEYSKIKYVAANCNMRLEPDLNSNIEKVLKINTKVEEVSVVGEWSKIKDNNKYFYIKSSLLSDEIIEEEEKEYLGKYVLTAYCGCASCCGKADCITASGKRASAGRTIAAPSSFPFGTILIINGKEYVVEDRGGAIKGNRIDIYFNSHSEALQFGRKSADVYIKK